MIENGLPAPLNITLIAGQEKVIEMQVSTQEGAFKDMSYYTYAGEAQGVDGKKYVIEAWVEADSPDVVLVRLPALGEGRYRWYVTTYTEDGVAGALVSGTLGVQWPEVVVKEERVKSPNRRVVVRFSDDTRAGVAHWVGTTWLDAALDGAIEAEKGAKAAAERLSVVDERLEQADALDKAFSEKMNDFIVPDETTGTWIVAGEDTGKPFKGRDGIDGVKIQRIEVANVEDIPTSGETCNGGYLYYVSGKLADQSKYILTADSQIYIHVDREGVELCIYFYDVSSLNTWITEARTIDDLVAEINSWDETWVRAERVNQNTIKVITLSRLARIECDSSYYAWMTIYPAYQVYAWITTQNGEQWVNTSEAFEAGGMSTASNTDVGGVKIVGSVGYSSAIYELPSNSAIKMYVDSAVGKCVKSEELNEYATKEEVADLATKAEVEGLASEDYVDQAVSELGESTYSKAEVNASFLTKSAAAERYIAHDAGYPRIEVLSRAAFDALPVRDSAVIYFIKKS